jgi:hypothetical protein
MRESILRLLLSGEGGGHGGDESLPAVGFGSQMFSASGGEAVEFRPAIVFGGAPNACEEFALFQAMEGGVEGALFDFEGGSGDLFDAQEDSVAVVGSEGEGFEDQEIEGSGEEVGHEGLLMGLGEG